MNLTLQRRQYRADGIFGEVTREDDGLILMVTCEHAYQDGDEWAPKLPPGTYRCVRGTHLGRNRPALCRGLSQQRHKRMSRGRADSQRVLAQDVALVGVTSHAQVSGHELSACEICAGQVSRIENESEILVSGITRHARVKVHLDIRDNLDAAVVRLPHLDGRYQLAGHFVGHVVAELDGA